MEISQGIVDFSVRMDGENISSVHRVTLPEFTPGREFMLSLEFPSVRSAVAALGSFQEQHRFEVFAAETVFSSIERRDEIHSHRYVCDAVPVQFQPGVVVSADSGSSRIQYRVSYYAAYLDDELLWEVDLPNGRCAIHGVDYSAEMWQKCV